MFTHIYNTAKRIVSRSPSAQDRSSEVRETPPTTHSLEVTMVTTRRGTETPGQDSTATPRSTGTRKVGKRELEALETPTAVKRQKKITPKKKVVEPEPEPAVEDAPAPDSAEDTSDTITIAVPPIQSQTPTKVGKLAIRRRSSPKVIVAKLSPPASAETESTEEALVEDALTPTQESVYGTPDQQSGSVYATPATRKKPEASPTPRATRANERTSSAKKSSGRKKKDEDATPTASSFADEVPSSTYESEMAPIPSQDAPDTPSQPEKAHVRFGSEEPGSTREKVTINLQGHKRYAAPTKTQVPDSDDDDDASDSDEAPEVVTTTAAASRAAAAQQDAARAQFAQQEKERAKREAREKRIADEQAEKRKRDEKKAKKVAKQLAQQQDSATTPHSTEISDKPAFDLAGLLPTSLLSNIPDQRAPTPPPARYGKTEEQLRKEKLNHHIKFLERTEKGIKEVKKGKLSVAVLAQQNRVLPPKANRDTRNVREKWLKGRQVEGKKGAKGIGGKVERRGFGNRGFLRGDD
jgi:U3 small nucleolar RNA-associated protein 16